MNSFALAKAFFPGFSLPCEAKLRKCKVCEVEKKLSPKQCKQIRECDYYSYCTADVCEGGNH